ncbi:MAG TPA: LysM peptidoglycan-binding domain-containing protein [Pseudobdellovibrionaceae bacterium]|mgnify:CR=1 FL=1|nr:LysM peptidoglycan-binding domain-containing protein [Pseudobdellovibrionaceae bacterium]
MSASVWTWSNFSRLSAACVLSLGLSACATSSVKTAASGTTGSMVEGADLGTSPNDLSDSGADMLGIPIEVNRLVLKWIDYFQGSGRPHMERYLSRSTRYAPIMKEILRKEGLPEDLIYIALIESGFSSTAHSSANAVGYWQFIRGTGLRYRLRIDNFVDDRRDFVKATYAAADYFKGLYNLFGAWYLAIASYNVGENRVKNLVMKNKTRDFWLLARENRLPQETINYVPKFLAARLIAKEPEKYGFTDIDYQPPLDFAEVEFGSAMDLRKLAAEMGLEYDDLRDLNPAYKRGIAPLSDRGADQGKLVLRVPRGTEAKAMAAAERSRASLTARYVAEDDYSYYRVRSGDTVSGIARKFNTTVREILRLNRMSLNTTLSVGRRLRVPAENVATLGPKRSSRNNRSTEQREPAQQVETRAAKSGAQVKVGSRVGRKVAQTPSRPATVKVATKTRSSKPAVVKSAPKVHVVRRGENLTQIARRYNVSLGALVEANDVKKSRPLYVGRKLSIPLR